MLPVPRAAACPTCDGPVVELAWTQLPLLRHGGYGEAERTVVECCAPCGSRRVRSVAAANPRAAATDG